MSLLGPVPASLTAAALWACCSALAASEVFQDWALRCPEDGQCVLEHRVLLEENDEMPLLHLALQYSGSPLALNAVIRVPLGVLLGPGLALTVDDGEPIAMPFHHCRQHGCLALLQVSDQLADSLRRGTAARVSYHLPDGRELGVPLSLYGVTAGLRALESRQGD